MVASCANLSVGNWIGYDSDSEAGPMSESWDVFHKENSVPAGDIRIDGPTNQDNAGATNEPNDDDTDANDDSGNTVEHVDDNAGLLTKQC